MGRKKGSGNKYISIKTRYDYDPQMLTDPTGPHDPIYWFNLLRIKTRRIVYIIRDTSNTVKQAASSDIDEYVVVENDLKPARPGVIITSTGPRLNNNLLKELTDMYKYITEYYIGKKFSEDPQLAKAEILSSVKAIESIITSAIEDTRPVTESVFAATVVEYCFLLHQKNGRFEETGHPKDFDKFISRNPVHNQKIKATLNAWHEFWLAHQPFIEELRNTFQCNSTFELKSGISYQNKAFRMWLEQGVDEYLEPSNRKITSVETQIKYLKYVILNQQFPKRKK